MTLTDSLDSVGKIAVVGMACRLPGAKTVREFWKNLREGKETIRFFSDEELQRKGVAPAITAHKNYVKACGVCEDPFSFDAAFFAYTPREAELIDPQQRVFLQCAWECLENAGYAPATYSGRIGLYAGAGPGRYLMQLFADSSVVNSAGALTLITSNDKDFLATRAGYKLNLKGPCVSVQTACSTSLSAIVVASHSLLAYQSDLALAGGVTLDLNEGVGYLYDEGGILSPDGHCRTFDASAKGTVPSSGVGVVALKRLEDAVRDRDTIYGVIIGCGLNNDGSTKVGFTAPGVDGQTAVSAEAIAMAGINPETITYMECHGTATPLGDPIELKALTNAFKIYTQKKGFCAVGSVKSNLGHTDAAAGVAGFIKTVLALQHKEIPPTLHVVKPNPAINFEDTPFYVNTALTDWRPGKTPRRAAQNSAGIGGTNAHVILEESPEIDRSSSSRPWQLLLWSAKTASALDTMTANLAQHLEEEPEVSLADVAYTLQTGRTQFEHRRMLVCQDAEDAIAALASDDPTRLLGAVRNKRTTSMAFLFPGQGSQYVNMGKELYETEIAFREIVDTCAESAEVHLGYDIRDLIFPPQDAPASAAALLDQTANTQPALFVVEYALARLWMKWGIHPVAMMGHSIGEYVAACLAGVFTVEEALSLVASRGKLMQELPHGAMLSVLLPEQDVDKLLSTESNLSIAALNAPNSSVIAGPIENIEKLEQRLNEKKILYRRLATSHAFHSPMMDPVLDRFKQVVEKVKLRAPKIPYVSNLTGDWITPAEATDPNYWVRHLRHTVRFSDGMKTLLKDTGRIFIEIGPGRTLSSLVARYPEKTADQQALLSLPTPNINEEGDLLFLLTTIGKLWLEGVALDWGAFWGEEKRGRIPLPAYPFEQQIYRISPSVVQKEASHASGLSKKEDLADWFYHPSWKRQPPLEGKRLPPGQGTWLLFVDSCGVGFQIAEQLKTDGYDVVSVTAGAEFQSGKQSFVIDPRNRDHYVALVAELKRDGKVPANVVHLWTVTSDAHPQDEIDCSSTTLDRGFYSLFFLAHALGSQYARTSIQLHVVTSDTFDVTGEPIVCPSKAAVCGPVKAIPREYAQIQGRMIDISLADNHASTDVLVDRLLAEFSAASKEEIVAYRGGHRWIQIFEPFRVEASQEHESKLRENGVYLIAGGTGGIGITLAEYLAKKVHARLILFGKSAFPAKDTWDTWLSSHDLQDQTSKKIRQLQKMEEDGATVLVYSADVADVVQMGAMIRQVKEQFGAIHGVINAAGVAGDGIIELKSVEKLREVLAPKVQGTLILEALLKDEPLDFFILCSSLTAFFGAAGQVDYTAANAFLDAFAISRRKSAKNPPVSINWDRWNEVGMAVRAVTRKAPDRSAEIPASNHEVFHHSVFSRHSIDGDTETLGGYLSPADHWIVGEHRISGVPTLVGTAYLELVRAGLAYRFPGEQIELRDLVFLSPLMIPGGERREIELVLKASGDQFEFKIRSRKDKSQWQDHAIGNARHSSEPELGDLCDIPALLERFGLSAEGTDAANQSPLQLDEKNIIQAGRRWRSLTALAQGHNEGLAVLQLPADYAADMADFELHPALLDAATSFAVMWAAKGGVYLPCSYDSIKIRKPLTQKLYSHVRYTPARSPQDELLSFDIEIFGEDGESLVEINGYSCKAVRPAKLNGFNGSAGEEPALPSGVEAQNGDETPFKPGEWGILSKEGIEIFLRVLSLTGMPQVAIASVDLNRLAADVRSTAAQMKLETRTSSLASAGTHPRPNLPTRYVAPRTDLEQSIAEVWQSVLGIKEVGIHDSFMDLGGHSLTAVQLVSQIREMFNIELPLARFYDNPTVVGLAEAVVQAMALEVDGEIVTEALQEMNGTSLEAEEPLRAALSS